MPRPIPPSDTAAPSAPLPFRSPNASASAAPNSPAATNAAVSARRSRRKSSAKPAPDGTTTDAFDPSTFTFGPEHDVVHELTYNREVYTARDQKWISLLAVPKQIIACVRRLRGQITEPSRPGVAVTMSCCLSRGLRLLSEDSQVIALDEFREEINVLGGECGKAGSTISRGELADLTHMLDGFPFSLPSTSSNGTRRQNFAVPPELLAQTEELRTTLGMSNTDLCVFAIALALAEQPSISPLDREEFRLASIEFAGRLYRRSAAARHWLLGVVNGARLSHSDMRIVRDENASNSVRQVGPSELAPEIIVPRDAENEPQIDQDN